jgi:hypothetical protein
VKQLQKLIQATSYTYPRPEEAEDSLHGCAALPGYVFGFVAQTGNGQWRTVTFHEVNEGTSLSELAELPKNLARVSAISGNL